MENQELINKVIVVSAKEEKLANGKPVMKVKDEKGLTYSVWKFKQDGKESVAWGKIPDLGVTTQIGYVENVKQDPEHGATTYRTIRTFNEDIGQGVANHKVQGATPQPNNFTTNPLYDKPEFKPRNFDQEAYEKCSSLWSASLLQRTGTTTKDAIAMVETGMCWELFQAIKADGKKRFFEFDKTTLTGSDKPLTASIAQGDMVEDLPTIQVQEDTTEWDKTFNCEVCNAPGRTHGDGHECLDF